MRLSVILWYIGQMAQLPRSAAQDHKETNEQVSIPQLAPASGLAFAARMMDPKVTSRSRQASQERQSSQERPLQSALPVVLFGYDGSTFTLKVRLALRLKQIPYTFVSIPGMAPRPILRNAFALPYRKVPILAIGRDIYIDTFLILEILEQRFPAPDHPTLYPAAEDGRNSRALTRLLTVHWADRPLFRSTVGLMPPWLWRSPFGIDRGKLIGHPLDAEKLARKVPENLATFDVHLNLVEDWLMDAEQAQSRSCKKSKKPWLLNTTNPSAADIALWYQLKWGQDVARGLNTNVLAGCTPEEGEVTTVPIDDVFNSKRYPSVWAWFERFEAFIEALSKLEKRVEDPNETLRAIKESEMVKIEDSVVKTIASKLKIFDSIGLKEGAEVVVSPNDTGRADPTTGTLIDISAEQVVIQPGRVDGRPADIQEANVAFKKKNEMLERGCAVFPLSCNKSKSVSASLSSSAPTITAPICALTKPRVRPLLASSSSHCAKMRYQSGEGIELEENSKASRRFSAAPSAKMVKTYVSDTRRFMIDLGPKAQRTWRSSTGIRTMATNIHVIRHATAFLLLLFFGFAPIFFYFRYVDTPFKTMPVPVSCDGFEEENDASTSGIQGLFMIDRSTGAFEFWVVKLIDIVWDLCVGRGLQWVAGWISYVVFSSALLRAIEASPIPYRTFIRLSIGTPSVYSIWSLLADLRRYSRKRTTLLFTYAALASVYVLAIPTLFGAMTGYLSTSISFTQLSGNEGQFVPTDSLTRGYVANGLANFSNTTCISTMDDVIRKMRQRLYSCPANACTAKEQEFCEEAGLPKDCNISFYGTYYDLTLKEECGFDDEITDEYYVAGEYYKCSDETGFMLDGHNYTFWEIYNATANSRNAAGYDTIYCYKTTPYHFAGGLERESQCLPNTANPGYQWGFSALLSSIVLIAQLVWGCSMYVVWIEAQMNSRLLRSGYSLTELRGAFAFAAAAEATTGIEAAELKGASVKSLEKLLFDKKAAVDFSLFSKELRSSEMAPLAREGGHDRSSSPLPPPPAYTRLTENSNFS